MSYFLFDIGGTKMRFAFTENCIECTEPRIVDSPDSYEEALEIIQKTKEEMTGGHEVRAAVGGTSGTFNKDKSKILLAPNNNDWVGREYKKDLEERLQTDVYVDNDTAVNAMGEAAYGAGKGYDIVGYMTVSTGVGGSRVVNGAPDAKTLSFEPGHQLLQKESDRSDQHGFSTLEDLVSGTAVERRRGIPAYEVPRDDELWDDLCHTLGVGVYNTLLHWSPDVMVLGGSMITGNPAIPIEGVKSHILEWHAQMANACTLVQAELNDLNGVYGALAWAKLLETRR